MHTKEIIFGGVPLVVPDFGGAQIEFPYDTFEGFGSYCGAGKGVGDLVVPEKILFLSISVACFIHDISWDAAGPTWSDFHQTNSMFLHNILSIIKHRSHSTILEHLRNYRAVTYYNAVDTVGARVFWNIKEEQRSNEI